MQSINKNNLGDQSDDRKVSQNDPEHTSEALKQAEMDISKDPDLSPAPDPAADLDEGELARLEGED